MRWRIVLSLCVGLVVCGVTTVWAIPSTSTSGGPSTGAVGGVGSTDTGPIPDCTGTVALQDADGTCITALTTSSSTDADALHTHDLKADIANQAHTGTTTLENVGIKDIFDLCDDTTDWNTWTTADTTPDVSAGSCWYSPLGTQYTVLDFDCGASACDNGHFLIVRALQDSAGILYECSSTQGLECGTVDLFRKLDAMDMWIRANDQWQLLSSTSAEDDMNNINPLPTGMKGIAADTIEAALGIFRFFDQGPGEDLSITVGTSGEVLFNTGSNGDLYRFNGDVEFLGGDLTLGAGNRDGVVDLFDDDSGGDQTLSIRAAQSTGSDTWTFELPPNDGPVGGVLQSNGSGISIWAPITGVDANIVSGEKGGNGTCAEWNTDGDLVEAASAAACGTADNHDLLSLTHDDTAVDAVSVGSMIRGSGTPEWEELVIAAGILASNGTTFIWDTTPDLGTPSALAANNGTTNLETADNNTTQLASTQFVQQEINGAGGTGLSCSSGQCNVDDDGHSHVITNIDAFTVSALQTQTSDVTTFYTEDTTVPVEDGGTGVSTLTDGAVLLGADAGNITALAITTDGAMIVGDGTTAPVVESGATLRTSIGVGVNDTVEFITLKIGSDPADLGDIRLENTAPLAWEDSENTQEVSITVSSAETFTVTATELGIGLATTTATECVMLNAAGINCDTTAGCATADTAGTNFDYTVAAFATAADDFGAWTFPTPQNLSGTTFIATVYWLGSETACDDTDTADDVCWTVAGAGIGDAGPFESASLGTSQGKVDRCIDDGELLITDVFDAVTHGWEEDELAIVEVSRDVDAGHADCAADAWPNDALLMAVRICYEVDNVFSGE